MAVQPWRDKPPDLLKDERDGQEQRDDHGQLERREERRGHIGGDHRCVGRQVLAQRRGNQCVDLLGEGEQPGKDQENDGNAAQQTGAQFGQVRNQRHWLVVFRILAHGARGG
ncbi:hypothetical protein D9M73_275860 [compost metagenome]